MLGLTSAGTLLAQAPAAPEAALGFAAPATSSSPPPVSILANQASTPPPRFPA
jgi:hypothetical protein